jgi:cysteine synthase
VKVGPSFDSLSVSNLEVDTLRNHDMIDNRTRFYIGLSFVAGVLLTLGFKDVYPDLERRFRSKLGRLRRRYSTTGSIAAVQLKDNTDSNDPIPQVPIPEGIEGCIGNTPLFKIRSLSEETGCEILAKAEFLNGAGNSPKDRVALRIIEEVRV